MHRFNFFSIHGFFPHGGHNGAGLLVGGLIALGVIVCVITLMKGEK